MVVERTLFIFTLLLDYDLWLDILAQQDGIVCQQQHVT